MFLTVKDMTLQCLIFSSSNCQRLRQLFDLICCYSCSCSYSGLTVSVVAHYKLSTQDFM